MMQAKQYVNNTVRNLDRKPVVEIKAFNVAGNGLAQATIQITHTEESRKDQAVVASAIREKCKGKMQVVAGSLHRKEKGQFADVFTGVLSAVREIVPMGEEAVAGFRCVASNMFMDDEKNMWSLKKTEAGNLLVKTTDIDDDMTLQALLQSVSSSSAISSPENSRMAAYASDVAQAAVGGAFVSYVGADERIHQGYVLASIAETNDVAVLPLGMTEEEIVPKAAITEVHDLGNDDPAVTEPQEVNEIVAAARGASPLKVLIDYYSRVYGKHREFFNQLVNRIKQHAYC